MSESTPSVRIRRTQTPPQYFIAHRRYLEFLLKDFDGRCAYSMVHHLRCGGISAMDVDHHNPTLPETSRNRYENLYLASRHCNGKKSDRWPTRAQRKIGIRFLDPCAEIDYGEQMFEDPDTFEIWGESPAAKYHIRILDLNAPHLVEERRNRFQMWKLYRDPSIVTMIGSPITAHTGVKAFSVELRQMIPLFAQKKKPVVA